MDSMDWLHLISPVLRIVVEQRFDCALAVMLEAVSRRVGMIFSADELQGPGLVVCKSPGIFSTKPS